MPKLTANDKSQLVQQIHYEQRLVKKYRDFASQCSDLKLKSKCSEIAQKHQAHLNTLLKLIDIDK